MQFDQLKRRKFITLLGGAAVWPLAARAQQPAKLPIIGFLGPSNSSVDGSRVTAFLERLRQLGWVEASNVTVEYRWADGRQERFGQLAAELVRQKVDVICTWGTATALAAKHATSIIPIVFTIVSDPVGSGLVASLARPGGNLTGLSTQHIEAAGKRLELLRDAVPQLSRLAIMANAGNPASVVEMHDLQDTADKLGLAVITAEFRRAEDIAPAFAQIKGRAEALFICPDALVNTNRDRINALALDARLPTMHGFRDPVMGGALMSYGPNYLDLIRRSADLVDKILRGARPAEIPVEQPTQFDLVINLKTAKALGLTIPDKLLALADEVIE
jgi:putative ABC transport system substrate-binding protein